MILTPNVNVSKLYWIIDNKVFKKGEGLNGKRKRAISGSNNH